MQDFNFNPVLDRDERAAGFSLLFCGARSEPRTFAHKGTCHTSQQKTSPRQFLVWPQGLTQHSWEPSLSLPDLMCTPQFPVCPKPCLLKGHSLWLLPRNHTALLPALASHTARTSKSASHTYCTPPHPHEASRSGLPCSWLHRELWSASFLSRAEVFEVTLVCSQLL